jgi:hypothetical protein
MASARIPCIRFISAAMLSGCLYCVARLLIQYCARLPGWLVD